MKLNSSLDIIGSTVLTAAVATMAWGKNVSDAFTQSLMPDFNLHPVLHVPVAVTNPYEFTVQEAQKYGAYAGYGTVIIAGAIIGGVVCAALKSQKNKAAAILQSNEPMLDKASFDQNAPSLPKNPTGPV